MLDTGTTMGSRRAFLAVDLDRDVVKAREQGNQTFAPQLTTSHM